MTKAIACLIALTLAHTAWAQDAHNHDHTHDQPTDKQDAPGPALPGLDELLGIDGPTSDGARALPDPAERDLDRELSGEQVAEAFTRAVMLMGETADRLQIARDTSLTTQRMQEQIIRDLDTLIAQAEQNQQQQQQQGASTSSQPNSQQQPNQPQPGQQPGQGDNRGEVSPPAQQAADLRPEENPDLASWGNLPERVRDALFQGAADQFSAVYRGMTEAYYRRLAEEAEK